MTLDNNCDQQKQQKQQQKQQQQQSSSSSTVRFNDTKSLNNNNINDSNSNKNTIRREINSNTPTIPSSITSSFSKLLTSNILPSTNNNNNNSSVIHSHPQTSIVNPHRFTPCKRKATTMLGFGRGDKNRPSNNNPSAAAAAAAAAASTPSIPDANNSNGNGIVNQLINHSQQQLQQSNDYQHLQTSAIGYQQAAVPYSTVRNFTNSIIPPQVQQLKDEPNEINNEDLLAHDQQQNKTRQEAQLPSSSHSNQVIDINNNDSNNNIFDQQHHIHSSQPFQLHHHLGGIRSLQHDSTNVQDEENTQRFGGVTIESPSSPGVGGYKRMRSSADSDAGSSSCKDIDESDVLAPDSVPALISELRQLLNYVASKPTLQHGSASFIRDYLRTMLIQNSKAAEEAIELANKNIKIENQNKNSKIKYNEYFKKIPEEIIKHILSFLDGKNLAKSREVCKKWNEYVCDEQLWKSLCLERWKSLETDEAVWKLIDRNIDIKKENKWRLIYPKVNKTPQWKCRLQKTGRFICNLVAHQISGAPLIDSGLPNVLVVERRFNIMHLATFVLPDASVLYFEPEKESDRAGFDDFIQYLDKRTRAGLALEEQRRFIFIPPCEYTRNQVDYQGKSLLGVVQNAYPPLAP